MRSNSASEPWISTWIPSSWPSGKNSRLWSVVKATIVPADGAFGLPLAASVPASQYTNAGMIEKIVPMIMKNQRPTIAWRIWSAGQPLVEATELGDRVGLLAERLRQQDARHAERLLGRGGQLGQRLLGLGRDLAPDLADAVGEVQEERRQAERQEREPPVEQEHRDGRADRDRQVARDRAGRVGHHRLDTTDVVGQPALDLARARLGEEAQRHALEVGVQRAPQVLHDVLADDVVEVALAHADEAR